MEREETKMQQNRGKKVRMPRFLLAAPKSGSGKTLFACGLIALCKRRGRKVAAAKCGPDYIDPMFHRKMLGVPSCNIDTYFTDENTTRYLLARGTSGAELTVLEGVMGYYDGLGGQSEKASTYEIAKATDTPVVLVVDGKGASVSLAAVVKGIVEYRADSNVKALLLNRVSAGYYPKLKELLEKECEIPVLGYLPELKDMEVPSRHLGLVAPEELIAFDEWIDRVADELEKTVEPEALFALAEAAPDISYEEPKLPKLQERVRIGIARDEAFSFYYEENLELLKRMGAELVAFSPLRDSALPGNLDGLLLGGGYPELYTKELEQNRLMRKAILRAVGAGIPCLAECGGFLYLQEKLEGDDGVSRDMTGVLPGKGFRTGKLCRFGYVSVETKTAGVLGEAGQCLKGHEFHYWDCTENGGDCEAGKPAVGALGELTRGRAYRCMVHNRTMAAGFPHFYYYSNPQAIYGFLHRCLQFQAGRRAQEKWDSIAKPIDGLGLLESYVVKLCRIAGNPAPPRIERRALLVLCGDHGVVAEGVTQTDSAVTKIVAENFAKGCSTVNCMARKAHVDVYTIDAGMHTPVYPEKQLVMGAVVDRKLGPGCGNIAREPAMTAEQCRRALTIGQELVRELKEKGYTIIATGEMGIGNTTPTSALAALLLQLPAEAVTGRGAGLDKEGLERKRRAVAAACERAAAKEFVKEGSVQKPLELLAEVGSFEIAMMAGVFLGGVREQVPVVIDGAISAVAALAADYLDGRVREYVLASHVSEESTAAYALKELGVEAILHGRMHLGEGTGAVALFPLLDMAAEVYSCMGSFDDLAIEAYERHS